MIENVIKRDGRVVKFDGIKITNAILKAGNVTHEFDSGVAEFISNIVITELEQEHDGELFSIEVIQNKIEHVLMRKGFYETAKAFVLYREKRRELRELKTHITPNLLEEYLGHGTWEVHENANIDYSIQGLKAYVSGKAEEIYWLEKVYPRKISELHKDGWVHIHNLSFLGAYTYCGKEVVIAKFNGKLLVSPFEKLYELINEKEEILNERDVAFAKYPKDLYVLDKNGWTKAKRIVRKKKDRDMHFIKNRGGRSVIVTDNHPMITEVGEKEAYKVGENDKTFTVDLKKLLSSEKLFKQDSINLLEEIKKRGWTYDDKVYANGVEIGELEDEEKYQEGFIHTLSSIAPVRIKLTEKFGYFVGFMLAEGYLSYDDSEPRCVSLTQKDKALLMKANEGLIENGMSGCINERDGKFELRVRNVFLRFLFENIFGITPGSKDKTLPLEILIYNKDFAKGLIAGLLDGDGNIETSNTTLSIRIVSRGMLEQLAVVMELMGFVPRDRDIEGQGSKRFFNGKELIQNFPMYGVSFRKIAEDLPSQKYRKAQLSTKAWHDEGKEEWHKVINNKKVNIPDEYIYDITTESGTLVVNGMWNHNCVGWDLEDLIKRGFGGVPGKPYSKPAKHLSAILGQMMNFLFTLQNEAAGAVAFSSFDTLLAPFVRYDKLTYEEVKQQIQEFVYNMNQTMRTGGQSPFSNLTLDISPHPLLKNKPIVIGGVEQNETYGEFQEEMNMINRAFWETMIEGDGHGRPHSVNGDSMCLIKENGKTKFIHIGEFIDTLMKQNKPLYIQTDNSEVLDVKNQYIETLGIKGGHVIWQKVNYVARHPVDKLLKITIDGGFSIKVTESHSVFILKDGEIKFYKASDLKIGDYLITPRVLPSNSIDTPLEISLAEEFIKRGKADGIYVRKVKKNGKRLWKKIYCKSSIGHISVFPISSIKDELPELDLSEANLSLAGSNIKIDNNLKISDELIELLGWYTAEGSAEKGKNYGGISLGLNLKKEKDKALYIAELIKRIWPDVPVKVREVEKRNLIEIRVHSKLIRRIFTEIFRYTKEQNRKIPDFIFDLPEKQKKIFLKAYFDGDGYISEDGISLTSISLSLAYGVSTILKQLGIFHSVHEYTANGRKQFRVNIWGNTDFTNDHRSYTISKIPVEESGLSVLVDRLLEKEPFYYDSLGRKYNNTKERVLRNLGIDPNVHSTGIDNARNAVNYLEKHKIDVPKTLNDILNDETLFLKIKKIEYVDTKNEMVYDFSTETENFIANNLLVHNTFPIPTLNVDKNFPWDSKELESMWEATAKFGIPYFANYINSDLSPDDARSMCIDGIEEILIRDSDTIKRMPIMDLVLNYKEGEFDEAGWADSKPHLEALSLNPKTLKMEWMPIKRFLKIKDTEGVRVTTEDGRTILFSLKHPMAVYTPRGIQMKFAKDIQKGDYLLMLKKVNDGVLPNQYQKIDNLILDEDFAKILGYFTADGNYLFESRKKYTHYGESRGIQFTFKYGDIENLGEIKRLFSKVFKAITHEKKDPRYNTYYLYVYNTEIARKLYNAGFRKYGRLPQILFNSPKSVIESFLEFYFKGAGYKKRQEIHLNDLELSRDLVSLFSLTGQPVTYKVRESSQVIRLQHSKSAVKESGLMNNPILSARVPGFLALSTTKVPELNKSRMVGLDTLDKYDAHTKESLKIRESDIYLTRVKEVVFQTFEEPKEFYDIELEENHLFALANGLMSFNCCRLKLDVRKLKSKGGGLFGANPLTGSVGVITVNMPRIGYLAKTEEEFFATLSDIMDASKDALEAKRKTVEKFTEMGLYPYSKIYLDSIKKSTGHYWDNHFSTIGLIGMNEALINFLGENLTTEQGINFVIKTLNFMREKLEKYQEETEHMYNLEATPSESTAYSLALKDKKLYPDIIVANESDVIKGAEPYYTNSTQLPVDYTDDPFEAAEKQEEIQSLYTGGTVLHFFLGERLTNGEYAKIFVKKILENFKLPYITLTPTFSICPKHGYIPGEYEFCPYCDEELAQGKDKKEDINKPEFFVR